MSIGNGTGEYVEREIADTNRLRDYEAEIAKGRRGLDYLDYTIGQLERLKVTRELNPALASPLATSRVSYS
jgi:hypothetical protein